MYVDFLFLQNSIEIAPAAKSKNFSIDKERTTDPLIRKRVPENAEGVAVLVGQLPELEKPASTFVRLAEGKLIPHFLEVWHMRYFTVFIHIQISPYFL